MQTKKITTPSGIYVEIKEYVTAREMNDYKRLFLSHINIDMSEVDISSSEETMKKTSMDKLPGTLLIDIEEKQIRLAVVSVNDNQSPDPVFDMKPEDYQFVLSEAKKLFDTQKKMNG